MSESHTDKEASKKTDRLQLKTVPDVLKFKYERHPSSKNASKEKSMKKSADEQPKKSKNKDENKREKYSKKLKNDNSRKRIESSKKFESVSNSEKASTVPNTSTKEPSKMSKKEMRTRKKEKLRRSECPPSKDASEDKFPKKSTNERPKKLEKRDEKKQKKYSKQSKDDNSRKRMESSKKSKTVSTSGKVNSIPKTSTKEPSKMPKEGMGTRMKEKKHSELFSSKRSSKDKLSKKTTDGRPKKARERDKKKLKRHVKESKESKNAAPPKTPKDVYTKKISKVIGESMKQLKNAKPKELLVKSDADDSKKSDLTPKLSRKVLKAPRKDVLSKVETTATDAKLTEKNCKKSSPKERLPKPGKDAGKMRKRKKLRTARSPNLLMSLSDIVNKRSSHTSYKLSPITDGGGKPPESFSSRIVSEVGAKIKSDGKLAVVKTDKAHKKLKDAGKETRKKKEKRSERERPADKSKSSGEGLSDVPSSKAETLIAIDAKKEQKKLSKLEKAGKKTKRKKQKTAHSPDLPSSLSDIVMEQPSLKSSSSGRSVASSVATSESGLKVPKTKSGRPRYKVHSCSCKRRRALQSKSPALHWRRRIKLSLIVHIGGRPIKVKSLGSYVIYG